MGFGDMGAVLVANVSLWDGFLEVKDMLVHMLRWLGNRSIRPAVTAIVYLMML